MRLKNKRSGFTLLEIIIVIIIVGVLASLALPRFFNTIEYAKSTEALNIIGTIKRSADRCAMAVEASGGTSPYYDACITFNQLGMEDPSNSAGFVPGAIFDYEDGAGTAGADWTVSTWTIVATRVGGKAAGDTITFAYNTSTGVITRTGSGAYIGLK